MNWFTKKRVLPRWKLILMIIIGVWMGGMLEQGKYVFAIIFGALGIWEITKKS